MYGGAHQPGTPTKTPTLECADAVALVRIHIAMTAVDAALFMGPPIDPSA
jgi:hypothetical protein